MKVTILAILSRRAKARQIAFISVVLISPTHSTLLVPRLALLRELQQAPHINIDFTSRRKSAKTPLAQHFEVPSFAQPDFAIHLSQNSLDFGRDGRARSFDFASAKGRFAAFSRPDL